MMTDAGFFRGTSADQDNRFANKQKKLLKEMNFSPILNTKLNMTKIDVESLKPWIEEKIKTVLEKDDELLSESIYEHLAEKEPDGKNILVLITGFVDDTKASKFMEELWTKLIDLQDNSNGVNKLDDCNSNIELKSKDNNDEETTKPDKLNEGNNNSNDEHMNKGSQERPRSSDSSHSVTPPSRSVSKSPGNRKLDELSRGRPRRRLQDDASRDGSRSPAERQPRSRSHSSSRSRSASVQRKTPAKTGTEDDNERRQSRSISRSKSSVSGSRSRSVSRSHTRSRSYSRSRTRSRSRSSSRSRSPRHRSRSPYNRLHRGRRSRSRSGGYRPRSRSPRGRRGFRGGRGPYRGPSFGGFHDRRRGGLETMRRRSPWGRRRFSPRSPPRRRRSPSFSPRRRRSPSPYHRRMSRSRSPPGHHMMSRNISPPRPHIPGGGHMNMLASRHMPQHDMHRSMPMTRSPRIPIDHRGYGDGPMLPRNSPVPPMINKLPILPSTSHGHMSSHAGPSGPGLHSPPSSGRKKHKKEKKHRKHKKSKKHRSPSPDKKKKHKKHKKSKKHKSH